MKPKEFSGILLVFTLTTLFLIIPSQADTIVWTNVSGGNWSVAANWSPNEVPGASDNVLITSNGTYLVTMDTSPTINSLTLGAASGEQTLTNASFSLTLNNASMIGTNGIFGVSGGSFGGSGNLGVEGVFNWSAGQLTPGSSLTIATNGVLNIEGEIYMQGELTNAGTVNWQGGEFLVYNYAPYGFTGEIWNETNALWDIQCDQTLSPAYYNLPIFHNAGVLQKDTTTGTTSFNLYLNNTGAVHAESGTIQFASGSDLGGNFQADSGAAIYFAGGSYAFSSAPTNFQGPGTVQLTSANVTLNGLTGTLTLNGSSLFGQSTVSGTGVLNLSGGVLLSGGSSLTIATNGVLNIEGTLAVQGMLTNDGTVNWEAGNINVYNGNGGAWTGGIWNQAGALWDIQCDGLALQDQTGNWQFQNAGLLRKDTTTGVTPFNAYLNNTGSVHAESGTIQFASGSDLGGNFQADSGAAIYFAGGSYAFSSAPTNFQGPGTVQLTSANVTLNGLTGTLTLNGSSLFGQSTVSGTGVLNLSGGVLLSGGSSLTIATNGVLNIEGTLAVQGMLTNDGTVNWEAGNINVYNGNGGAWTGGIWNQAGALWDIQCDGLALQDQTGNWQFQNAGLLRKDTTTGVTPFNAYLNNTGSVQAQSGTITFNDGSNLGGTFQADSGAAIYFAGGSYAFSSAPTNFQGPGTVQLTSANVTLNGLTGTLTLNGSSLFGQSTVSGTGVLNLSGGVLLSGGSSLTIATNGVLNIEGTLAVQGMLTNDGTVNWEAGNINVYNGNGGAWTGGIWNQAGALWDIQCDGLALQDQTGNWQFQNAGLLRKDTTTGVTPFNAYLNNTGSVHAESGTIQFASGSDLGGNFQADSGAAIYFAGGSYAFSSAPTNFQGPGTVQLTSANVTLNGLTGTLTLNGSSLFGQSTVSGTGVLNLSGGVLLSGGSSLTIATNGVLNIEGTLAVQGMLTNDGTVNWEAGNINVYNGNGGAWTGGIWNQAGALWDIQCDGLALQDQTGNWQFQNAGLLRKDTTTGVTPFNAYLNNTGSVQAQSGTITFNDGSNLGGTFQADSGAAIYFAGGSYAFSSAPTNFQGPGTVQLTSANVTLNGLTGTLTLNGSSLFGQSTVSGTGVLNLSGGVLLSGGSSLTIATNGVLNIEGTLAVQGMLTNDGTVNWEAGNINVYNGNGGAWTGGIWNQAGALWDIQCDGLALQDQTGNWQFQNAGLLRKDTTTGVTPFNAYLNNTGSVHAESGTIQFASGSDLGGNFQADSGAAIYFAGGSYAFSSAPTNFQGPGTVQLTSANVTLNGLTGTLTLNGSSLFGQSTVSGTGVLNLSGGVLLSGGSSLTIATNGVLNIEGTLAVQGMLTNDGTVNWEAGNINVYNGNGGAWTGGIWNQAGALWDIQCDGLALQDQTGNWQFQNAGLLRKDTTTGVTPFNAYLNNTGSVQAQSGTITFNDGSNLGGTFQADSGAAIYFAGGSYAFSSAPTNFQGPGTVQLTSANVTLNGLTGTLTLNGSSLFGQSTVSGTGVLNLSGGVLLSGGSSLTIATNGVLNIEGTLAVQGMLTNDGTVNWEAGNINVYNGNGGAWTGGIWNQAGALWDIQCDGLALQDQTGNWQFQNAGLLRKDTTTGVTPFNAYLNNTGSVEADTGSISLQGGYSGSPSASVAVSLGGATPATGFGTISFSAPPALNGTFTVTTTNGFQPSPGDTFSVLSYLSSTGGFTDFASPSGAIFQTNYTPTSFVLSNIGQITWTTPTNITYGTALGTNQLDASTIPNVAGTFTYNPAAGTVMNSGEQLLTATFTPSDPNYAPASFQVPITVLKAPLGITATNQTKTYGQNLSLSGTEFMTSGLVNGDTVTSATLASAGAISNAPVSGSPYAITINNALGDAGLTNYIITYTDGDLTVNPAPLGITANSFSKTYGSNVVFAGMEFVSTTLSNQETIGTVTLTSAGAISNAPVSGSPYSILPSAATGGTFTPGNYAITYTNGTLTVNRTGLTVTANPASREYGVANPAFSATFSGFVNGETASVISGAPGFSTSATVTSGVGNYSVTPSLGTLNAANYTFGPYINGTLTLNPAPLTIASGITVNNKVYDRTTMATLSSNNVALATVFNGDTVSLNTNAYVANFASAEVGNNIAVTVTGLTLSGARATNYTLTQPAGLAANITAATVTISSGITANNKVYDRTTTATLSSNSVVLSGIVSGDTLTLNTNGYAANFASAGVGNGVAVTVTGLTLAGASNADYTLTQPAGLTASITAAAVTISSGITANNKVYDRTTTATLSSNSVVLSGIVSGDTLTLNTNGYAANFASAGVGNGIAVTVTGLTLAGASNADYTLTQPAGLTASITAATVTISSGITANNKVYDRTTTATLASNNVILSGVVSGDTLTLNTNGYVANFASAGVGNGIAVTVSGLTLTGASNADYTLTQPAGLTASITAAAVTISSGITANSKVYDRTTTATLSSNNVVLSGVVSGDTLTLNTNGYAANFASAGVGSGIAVTVTGLTLTGASNADYTLTQPTGLTANIMAVPVTISSGIAANNKVYDRTTTATLSSNAVVLAGIVSGDTVTLNTNGYVANFASAGVGSGIAVTVTGLTLTGASNADYTLTQPSSLTATIAAAPVSITSGITANNKVYDRTTTATLRSNNVVLSGIVSGDTLTLNTNAYVANFASAGVGSGIAVTVSGLTLAGASNADYTLTQPATLTANITATTVTITSGITANNKFFDNTTTATLSSNSVVLAGVLNGDTLSLHTNGYTATFASAGVGSGIAVTVAGLSLTGASNADYTLTQPAGLTANITLPSLTLTASLTNVILSWPANASAFVLNKTASLTLPITSWTPVTSGISVVGTNNTITNNASSGNEFYTLIAP